MRGAQTNETAPDHFCEYHIRDVGKNRKALQEEMSGPLTDTKVTAIEEEIDVCILPREWNHNRVILGQM